ncbi:MAG: hypothetical protein U0163_16785 [Gemmatimonadaceae bacterium]
MRLPRAIIFAASALATACHARPAVVTNNPPPAPPAVTDGRGVLRLMQQHYAKQWFRTLSFSQRTTTYATSGRETKGVWHEYLAVPGRLRIDYTPLSEHSGVLFAGNAIHSFVNGKVAAKQGGWNPALILIADVYVQPVDTSAWQLDSLGFKTSIVRRDSLGGRAMWVVGAARGDTTSSQFWVDTDSLLVRRLIQKQITPQRTSVTDIRLGAYTDVGGYPVAFEILFYRDGRLFFREDYYDAAVNQPIAPDVFDPATFVSSQIKRGTPAK